MAAPTHLKTEPAHTEVATPHSGLDGDTEYAHGSADSLYYAMFLSLQKVSLDTKGYLLDAEHEPVWADLAALAIEVSTSGIGAGVARIAGPRLQAVHGGNERSLERGLAEVGHVASVNASAAAVTGNLGARLFAAQDAGLAAYHKALDAFIDREREALRPAAAIPGPDRAAQTMAILSESLVEVCADAAALQGEASKAAIITLEARVEHTADHPTATGLATAASRAAAASAGGAGGRP